MLISVVTLVFKTKCSFLVKTLIYWPPPGDLDKWSSSVYRVWLFLQSISSLFTGVYRIQQVKLHIFRCFQGLDLTPAFVKKISCFGQWSSGVAFRRSLSSFLPWELEVWFLRHSKRQIMELNSIYPDFLFSPFSYQTTLLYHLGLY